MTTQAVTTATHDTLHKRIGKAAFRLLERMTESAYRGYQARMASRFTYL